MPLLHEAMQTPDPETGRSRGYMLVAKGLVSESLLFTIDKARYREWEALADWLRAAAGQVHRLVSGPGGNRWMCTPIRKTVSCIKFDLHCILVVLLMAASR